MSNLTDFSTETAAPLKSKLFMFSSSRDRVLTLLKEILQEVKIIAVKKKRS